MKKSETNTLTVKRKLFFAAAGWLSGLAVFSCFGFGMSIIIISAAVLISAAVFVFVSRKYAMYTSLVLTFLLLGCLYNYSYTERNIAPLYRMQGKEVRLTGYVTDITRYDSSALLEISGHINGTKANIRIYTDDLSFDYYDNISVSFTADRISSSRLFDSEGYCFSKGIFIENSGAAECRRLGGCENRLMYRIRHYRDRLKDDILSICGDESGGFITACFCSDKSGLDAETRAAVYRAGIGHLFAVSGTHIVIIASFLQLFLSLFLSPGARNSAVIFIIWLFAVFAGLSPSVIRACIMMTLLLISAPLNRRADCANSLGGAVLLLTLPCPYIITSVSFIMSFVSAFAAGAAVPYFAKDLKKQKSHSAVYSAMLISMFTMPLTALFFNEISLVSVISNILLIPLCTVILILVFLYAPFGSALSILLKAADLISIIVIKLCRLLTTSPVTYAGTSQKAAIILISLVCITAAVISAVRKKHTVSAAAVSYLILIAAASLLSNLPQPERLLIIPERYGYTAVYLTNGNAFVFDMNGYGNSSYYIEGLCERYSISQKYVYITAGEERTVRSYEKNLTDDRSYFSDKAKLCMALPDRIELENLSVVKDGRKQFSIYDNKKDKIICSFSTAEIMVNEKSYSASGFTDLSEFIL